MKVCFWICVALVMTGVNVIAQSLRSFTEEKTR